MEELRFEIAEDMEDERIDKCISLLVEELSRSFIQKLIKDGNVLVNGKPVKGSFRVKCEDEVVFSVLMIDRHLLPVIRMSADGLIYGSFLLLQFPETDGPISPVNGMFL